MCIKFHFSNTDVVKRSRGKDFIILEALHFEMFLPDRNDLRFIAVDYDEKMENAAEGDYVLVTEVSIHLSTMEVIERRGLDGVHASLLRKMCPTLFYCANQMLQAPKYPSA